MNDLICVGAISGAFGVQGEVRLKSFTSDPMAIGDYAPLCTEDGKRIFEVKITRPVANGLAAYLSGIKTKEDADAMKGTRLYAERSRMPALPDDEFYHADLIGLTAFDTGGVELGRVHAVHDHGAGDILEIMGPKGETLVPFTLHAVPTVDMKASRVIVDLTEEDQ